METRKNFENENDDLENIIPKELIHNDEFLIEMKDLKMNLYGSIDNLEDDSIATDLLSYQEQLEKMIKTVATDESHLFDEEEWEIINQFHSLSDDGKGFIFRLLTRPSNYLRSSRLRWNSISDMGKTIQELVNLKYPYLSCDGPKDIEEWLELLAKDELKHYCNHFKIPIDSKMKVEAIKTFIMKQIKTQKTLNILGSSEKENVIDSEYKIQQRLFSKIKKDIGNVIKITDRCKRLFHSLYIIYSRSAHWPNQDNFLVNSILTNVKTSRRNFPKYQVDRISLTWPTKETFLEYREALEIEYEFEQLLEKELIEEAVKIHDEANQRWKKSIHYEKCKMERGEGGHLTNIPWLQVFTAGRVLTSVMHHSIEPLYKRALNMKREQSQPKKQKLNFGKKKQNNEHILYIVDLLQQLLAQSFFLQNKRGKWYDHLAKMYHHHLQDYELAKQTCMAALDSDNEPFVCTGFRSSISKRLARIRGNSIKDKEYASETIYAKKVFSKIGYKSLWIDHETQEEVRVEELCVRYYERCGWRAIHSENSVLTTLFSLLFWDVIFAPVPGAFASEYQVAPLDLHTEYFVSARKELIEKRLTEIKDGKFLEIIGETYDRERPKNTFCIGLNWNKFTRQDIMEIALCMGAEGLAGICDAYINLYWSHSGGVPDLCIWKIDEMKLELVEVKVEFSILFESLVLIII